MSLAPAWLGLRELVVGTFVCFPQTAAQIVDGALRCLHCFKRTRLAHVSAPPGGLDDVMSRQLVLVTNFFDLVLQWPSYAA